MSVENCESIYRLHKAVPLLIAEGGIDKALRLIHHLVEDVITEPLCVSQIFGSKKLDDLCQQVGAANLAKLQLRVNSNMTARSHQSAIIYIVTKIQKSGGHTRIIGDFIRARPNLLHIILSTELSGKSNESYWVARLSASANVVFEKAPRGNFQQRLTWLQKRLLSLRPQKVYLLNHHQDTVAVAALQPEMNLDACFYHHGDHHLCLGVYLSHLEHVDPHPMGYHNCRTVLGIENSYVPLTVADKGERPSDWPFLPNGIPTTCTAARSNKVEIPYFVSYLEMVPRILKCTGGRHIHIGQLTPWALREIRRGLKRQGIERTRFIYTPWVPSVWHALQEYRVDLYIASFPYGGGLTLIEAMGAGVPVALHKHIYSRILSGLDLAHPEAFSWRYPDELLNYCASLSSPALIEASRKGRIQYEQFYSRRSFQEALEAPPGNRQKPDSLPENFFVESDEWALWMERQINLRKLFFRTAYRTFRRLRARSG